MEEKREFFRVGDRIFLNYRVIDQKDFDESVLRLRSGIDKRRQISDSLQNTNTLLIELLSALEKSQPDIVPVIKLLNHKTNIISQAVDSQIIDDNRPMSTYDVTLSGGGLSFKSTENIDVSDLLEINLILYPIARSIRSFGEVIHCNGNASQPDFKGYDIGVKFVYLSEDDREFIVSHVLNAQSNQLRILKNPPLLE
jgi:PilZ domain-containing protein